MKDCTITAKSSITRSLGPLILGNIYGPFMKVCDIHAISANISLLLKYCICQPLGYENIGPLANISILGSRVNFYFF